jgi:metal-responsive CopG/Arc/MetJ family transcriptional regulator
VGRIGMGSNSEFIRVSADLPNDLYRELRDRAFGMGISHVEFIRAAIEEKLKRDLSVKTSPRVLNPRK